MRKTKLISPEEIEAFNQKRTKFSSDAKKTDETIINSYIKEDGKVHISRKIGKEQSEDFVNSLETQCSLFRATLPIVMDVYTEPDVELTKESLEGSISAYYQIKFYEQKKSLQKDKILAWMFLGLGVLIMSFYVAMCVIDKLPVFREVVSIFSWVFIWEFFDRICFDFPKRREGLLKLVQLGTIEINIIKNENN